MKLYLTLEDGENKVERVIFVRDSNSIAGIDEIVESMASNIEEAKADDWFKTGIGQVQAKSGNNFPLDYKDLDY